MKKEVLFRLKLVEQKLDTVLLVLEKIMASLDDVLADVTAESTKLDSLTAFVAGLKQQLADALAGANLPPAVQSKVDAIFAAVETNKQKVQDALDANVPPVPQSATHGHKKP